MKKYKQNDSSIGTATHIFKYCYKTNDTKTQKRSRYKCIYYIYKTTICKKLNISCVGPSNSLCKNYCEKKSIKKIDVGTLVNSSQYGIGMIINVHNSVYRVKYNNTNIIRSYWYDEIKKIVLK